MSSKPISKKRGRINVVACNKCKRDKKKCDGSYLTQKPCKHCRDRNEYCEYTEPNRLRNIRIQGDDDDNDIMSNVDIMNENFSGQNQQRKLDDYKPDLFLGLLTDPSTTGEQMNILKRLYNEIMKNPEDSKFIGNKRDELCMKLKLLSSSNNNDHMKIQIWDDLFSSVNDLDKIIKNCKENNSTTLDSLFDNFNPWNPENLNFTSSITHNNTTTTETTSRQFNEMNYSTTILNNQQDKPVSNVRNDQKIKNVKDNKKRKTRKIQKGNKRTQPYPAGGQIVIRPSKQAHTMIWHQNDPIDDVPIMAFQLQPTTPPTPTQTPPPATRPPQRTQFQQQQPLPSFSQFQSMMPVNLWDHSTTMTMLSPKPSSTFPEPELNNKEEILPVTNSILLSPTPSLHDDVGDVVSSPSSSSVDHMRVISDDEKDHFGLISLAPTTGSPQSSQSSSLFTVEDFIEMWSNSSSVTDDLSVVEPIWNC